MALIFLDLQIIDEKSLIKKYQKEILKLKQELEQLKRGITEQPYLVASDQDLVSLKQQVLLLFKVDKLELLSVPKTQDYIDIICSLVYLLINLCCYEFSLPLGLCKKFFHFFIHINLGCRKCHSPVSGPKTCMKPIAYHPKCFLHHTAVRKYVS